MSTVLKNPIFIFLAPCSTILFSCMNKYERRAIGIYEVDKYEILDSSIKIGSPTLSLNSDKTFILAFKDKKIVGKWEADDYGDWAVVDFFYENHHHTQRQLLGQDFEILKIVTPLDFYLDARLFHLKETKAINNITEKFN